LTVPIQKQRKTRNASSGDKTIQRQTTPPFRSPEGNDSRLEKSKKAIDYTGNDQQNG
jgi:hypothetical protein